MKKGLPFRDAYKITGTLVARCIAEGCTLETLPLAAYKEACPQFDEDVFTAISLETCLNGRISEGGPSAEAVRNQLAAAKAAIEELNA